MTETNGLTKMALFNKGVLDKQTEISMLVKQTKAQWSDEDLKRVKDLQKYTLDKEDSWVLDEALLKFVGDVLNSSSSETKVRLLRVLAVCALKESFITFLNQDRQRRHLMNYANNFDKISLNEQKAVAIFICNLFSHVKTQNWALYFSEWAQGASGREKQTDEECIENILFEDPEITSNARITSKVARICLESLNPSLQDYGSAICYNIATRDIRVMQRPMSQDETLDTNDVKNFSLQASNGKNVATLRAYDAIALELCICVIMLLKKNVRNLSEVVHWRCLQSAVNFLPLIQSDLKHYYPGSLQEDINELMEVPFSERNSKLVLELLANFTTKSTSN